MSDFTVCVIGTDRPGIVAAVTGALLDLDANVEGCRACLLSGSFAMVLAVDVPDGMTPADVDRVLAPVAEALDLSVSTVACTPPPHGDDREHCVVTIYGGDRPGIVHGAAVALANHGANIVDLSASLVGDPPIYILGIEVEVPPGMTTQAIASALHTPVLAGLDISVQPVSERMM
ncbi:MAG: hypothetical protein EXQ74_00440 [Thermoleophilia bacterium]|nr:hypothetical protein [Thermoleophilia bacterium]